MEEGLGGTMATTADITTTSRAPVPLIMAGEGEVQRRPPGGQIVGDILVEVTAITAGVMEDQDTTQDIMGDGTMVEDGTTEEEGASGTVNVPAR